MFMNNTQKIEQNVNGVESSFISSVAVSGKELKVGIGNKTYTYSNVPENVSSALCKAESKGSFFNKNIRNKYVPIVEKAK